jgi:hypothetical protein
MTAGKRVNSMTSRRHASRRSVKILPNESMKQCAAIPHGMCVSRTTALHQNRAFNDAAETLCRRARHLG